MICIVKTIKSRTIVSPANIVGGWRCLSTSIETKSRELCANTVVIQPKEIRKKKRKKKVVFKLITSFIVAILSQDYYMLALQSYHPQSLLHQFLFLGGQY